MKCKNQTKRSYTQLFIPALLFAGIGMTQINLLQKENGTCILQRLDGNNSLFWIQYLLHTLTSNSPGSSSSYSSSFFFIMPYLLIVWWLEIMQFIGSCSAFDKLSLHTEYWTLWVSDLTFLTQPIITPFPGYFSLPTSLMKLPFLHKFTGAGVLSSPTPRFLLDRNALGFPSFTFCFYLTTLPRTGWFAGSTLSTNPLKYAGMHT